MFRDGNEMCKLISRGRARNLAMLCIVLCIFVYNVYMYFCLDSSSCFEQGDYICVVIAVFCINCIFVNICIFVCFALYICWTARSIARMKVLFPSLQKKSLIFFFFRGHLGLRYDFLREKNMDRSIDLAVQHIQSIYLSAWNLIFYT